MLNNVIAIFIYFQKKANIYIYIFVRKRKNIFIKQNKFYKLQNNLYMKQKK